MRANPAEDLVAVHAGEFEIEQDEVGKRELVAVAVFFDAEKVSDGFLAVGDNVQGEIEVCGGQSAANKDDIILAIFNQQNDTAFWHRTT